MFTGKDDIRVWSCQKYLLWVSVGKAQHIILTVQDIPALIDYILLQLGFQSFNCVSVIYLIIDKVANICFKGNIVVSLVRNETAVNIILFENFF